MKTLTVSASRKYDITVTTGFGAIKSVTDKLSEAKKIAVITDDAVKELYAEAVIGLFPDKKTTLLSVPAGEKSKNGENYLKLLSALAENGFQRKDAIVALGGGVVGDLAGFVASTYMRGITLIAMPTTLLSAVDSSVGGKTAIDLPDGKNLCGTFYQPAAVYINLDFLKSLPDKEITNGFGEIVKYALLDTRVTAEAIGKGITEDLVYKCLSVKRDVVQADEFEGNRRMILNLGHTVGHAIEKLSGYTLSHGECVAKGIAAAIEISKEVYPLTNVNYGKMKKLLNCYPFDLSPVYGADEIADCVKADKKGDGDAVNFVLLKGIGEPCVRRIDYQTLKNYLNKIYANHN